MPLADTVRFIGFKPEDGRWKVWGVIGDIHKIGVAVNNKGEKTFDGEKCDVNYEHDWFVVPFFNYLHYGAQSGGPELTHFF